MVLQHSDDGDCQKVMEFDLGLIVASLKIFACYKLHENEAKGVM